MGLINGNKGFLFGFVVGFGTGAIFRDTAPYLRKAVSPSMKLTLKGLILLIEKSRETSAQFLETIQDMMAEVADELRRSKSAKVKTPQASKKSSSRKKKSPIGPSINGKAPETTPAESDAMKVVSLTERRIPS